MSFNLTVLGSGSALPLFNRFQSAQIIEKNDKLYLIDCGEGTQIQLINLKFSFYKLNDIFITHLHGDHFFGLMGLLSSMHLLKKQNTVNIYAHKDLLDIINLTLKPNETDLSFKINFIALSYNEVNLIFKDKYFEVYSIPLNHSLATCGFIFREKIPLLNVNKDFLLEHNPSYDQINGIKNGMDYKDGNGIVYPNASISHISKLPSSFAYISDTIYKPDIVDHLQNISLLYHEATFSNEFQQAAIDKLHSTSAEAALIAKNA
ncbi:MAG: hypothetical protein A2X12_08530, partial [Bacteroidetes bacterium GWE2_29_8]